MCIAHLALHLDIATSAEYDTPHHYRSGASCGIHDDIDTRRLKQHSLEGWLTSERGMTAAAAARDLDVERRGFFAPTLNSSKK
jgi:hypothetical protein